MDELKAAVRRYTARHANPDGLAYTPVPGLRMMCIEAPRADLHAIYRPLVCMVLSGVKNVVMGTQERVFRAGQSFLISADMPVAGRILEADSKHPFLAITVELDLSILTEVGLHIPAATALDVSGEAALFDEDEEAVLLDCARRLFRLVDRPDAVSLLRPGIMRELHFALLSGRHAPSLRTLVPPDSTDSRLARAISELRAGYRGHVSPDQLAEIAGMGLSVFHRRFKQVTSLTPGQFQQQLRLIEAKRLMSERNSTASRAAFEVGYRSVSQFNREFRRLFGTSPTGRAAA